MPVDYSKWDALELSDDSDIEVHPNVDKRSFIRAKQSQIHQQRVDRKQRITTLKYERVINDGLLLRIDALLARLREHSKEIEPSAEAEAVDEVVFDALMEVGSDESLGADYPPAPPEGVHADQEQPSYSKMMGALVDQVKGEVQKAKAAGGLERYAAYITEAGRHHSKVANLQKDLVVELNRLEKEEGSKITSESIHTGFNSSHVSKGVHPASTPAEPELLNPSRPATSGAQTVDAAAGAEGAAKDEDDDADIEASPLAKRFARLPPGDYGASLRFIGSHPDIMSERETDGLLAEAFQAQMDAKAKKEEDYARQCVHQALLLQYCRQLGKDGVGLFFHRVQTANHQAQKVFLDDVNNTYARIRSRTAELARQREGEGEGEREQIQLHAVNPGSTINIVTPPPLEQCESDEARASREIFESFPPGLRGALESGELEKVNEVLGKMGVEEAEKVVELLGEGGMLSLEEGVIDATTEEGKKQVEEIERMKKMSVNEGGKATGAVEEMEDPGMD